MTYEDFLAERKQLLERIKKLEAENAELRKLLGEHIQQSTTDLTLPISHEPTAMQTLSPEEKVELFRSLFKGREDVFARRWYSKTTGISPSCSCSAGRLGTLPMLKHKCKVTLSNDY